MQSRPQTAESPIGLWAQTRFSGDSAGGTGEVRGVVAQEAWCACGAFAALDQ